MIDAKFDDTRAIRFEVLKLTLTAFVHEGEGALPLDPDETVRYAEALARFVIEGK